MAIKFSRAQIEFLTATGSVRSGKLTIDLASLVEAGPSRTRTSLDEKRAKFNALVAATEADETGRKVITAVALHGAGLPSTYMTNNAVWSGVSEGSELAFDLGYSAKYNSAFDPALGGNKVSVTLVPLTDADKVKRAKQRASAAAKAEAAKEAEEAEGSGEAETDEHGIPAEDTAETEPEAVAS